jgi:hypothetical protein
MDNGGPTLPSSRAYMAHWIDTPNKSVYFFGGTQGTNGHYNDIWKYNMATKNWTQIRAQQQDFYTPFQSINPPYTLFPPWPGGRSNMAWTYVPESKMFYMFGGQNYNGNPYFADWWSLNTTSWEWKWIGGIQSTSGNNGFNGNLNQSTVGARVGPRANAKMWSVNGN